MRLERLKAFALSLPHTTAQIQWGADLVFKIGGKMFLVLSLDGGVLERVSFKCTTAEFKRLTSDFDGIVPAPYLARASWVGVEDPAVLPESELHVLIKISYDLVRASLPKKIQATLSPTK